MMVQPISFRNIALARDYVPAAQPRTPAAGVTPAHGSAVQPRLVTQALPSEAKPPARPVTYGELVNAALNQSIKSQAAQLKILSALRDRNAAGFSLPFMPTLGLEVTADPSRTPEKKQLDQTIQAARSAQVDVSAQVTLEVTKALTQAQISKAQIERDTIKRDAIEQVLAEARLRVNTGVELEQNLQSLYADRDTLNKEISKNQQTLDEKLNLITELTGLEVRQDQLPTFKRSAGKDYLQQQPQLLLYDAQVSGNPRKGTPALSDAQLINQYAARQNTQVDRLAKEIEVAKAALTFARSQRKPKITVGFSFPLIPSIKITGGDNPDNRRKIAKAETDLETASLALEEYKRRNATEIRNTAARVRMDSPNTNDSSWNQAMLEARAALLGNERPSGKRAAGLVQAYQELVSFYQANTRLKGDLYKTYASLIDNLYKPAVSSLNLMSDIATLRYATGQLDSAQERTALLTELQSVFEPLPSARQTYIPVPQFAPQKNQNNLQRP
jgi:hypothetical protein